MASSFGRIQWNQIVLRLALRTDGDLLRACPHKVKDARNDEEAQQHDKEAPVDFRANLGTYASTTSAAKVRRWRIEEICGAVKKSHVSNPKGRRLPDVQREVTHRA